MAWNREKMDPHDLAALLMVFAVGTAGDFTLSPSSEEAELYFRLANAALALRPSWTLQLFLPSRQSVSWLYGDPTHWKFESKMIQRRRTMFWELRQMDAWTSIGSGRSAVVHPDDVDCELPIDADSTLREWCGGAQRLVLETLVPSGYAKVREFGPRSMAHQIVKAIGADTHVGIDGVCAYFQKYILSVMKDMSLQLLHRNFFARALLENSRNPIQSSFAPSFLSCYNSAISILRVVREHFNALSHVMVRYWSTWAHSLISAVLLGSVASRAPTLELAQRAYVDLALSIDIFMRARAHPLIQAALVRMLRLRERARLALLEVGKDPDKFMKELGSVTLLLVQGVIEQEPVSREEFDMPAPGIASNGSGDCAIASVPGLPSTSIAGDQGSGFSDGPILSSFVSYLPVIRSDATISDRQPFLRENSSLRIGPKTSTFPFEFGNNTQESILSGTIEFCSPWMTSYPPVLTIRFPFLISWVLGMLSLGGIPGFSTTMQETDFATLVPMSIDNSSCPSNTPNVQQDVRGLASTMASGNTVTATASNPELVDLATLGCSNSTADASGAYAG
ncbi:hypothetical protein ACEPAI_1511 [Sanghuangporus weigelae]